VELQPLNAYHVITPFSRWGNLPALIKMLRPEGVQWHLLLDEDMPLVESRFSDWIRSFHGRPPPPRFFIGHWLLNLFLDEYEIVDEDYYVLMTDDDYFEPGFFDKIRKYTDDIIICSMRRSGDKLVADPSNIRIGHVGLEQLIIKGKILKQYRCNGFYEADGDLIIRLFQEHGPKFRFAPEAVCFFNFLPPWGNGRLDQWGAI
jgi:hypothetical protein